MWYCPGSILALWVMERHGLRTSLLAGFASQLMMIALTVTGVHLAEPHLAYGVVWVGQARCGEAVAWRCSESARGLGARHACDARAARCCR